MYKARYQTYRMNKGRRDFGRFRRNNTAAKQKPVITAPAKLSLAKDFKLVKKIDCGLLAYKIYGPKSEIANAVFKSKGRSAIITLASEAIENTVRVFNKNENIGQELKCIIEKARKHSELEDELKNAFQTIKRCIAQLSTPPPKAEVFG